MSVTHAPVTHALDGPTPCEECGQLKAPSNLDTTHDRWLCDLCRERLYGAGERHEQDQLFCPPARQIPGQTRMEE